MEPRRHRKGGGRDLLLLSIFRHFLWLPLSLFLSLSVCLPLSFSVSLSVCLSISLSQSLCLSASLSFSVSVGLPLSLSLSLSVCLSVCLSLFLPVSLSSLFPPRETVKSVSCACLELNPYMLCSTALPYSQLSTTPVGMRSLGSRASGRPDSPMGQ